MTGADSEKRWILYSWAIIFLFFLLLGLRWLLLPNFLDIYYHLSVAQGFAKAGGFSSHDFWSYAPVGRAHLYPPLFHFIILLFLKLGLPVLSIARLLDFISFPLLLAVIWFFMRSLFSARIAFFAVLISSSLYSFYLASANFIPVTLSFILGLFSFWAFERGKIISASLLLALAFYAHAQIPWFLVLVYLIYGLLNRGILTRCLKTVFFAVLAALPLLVYLFQNSSYYNPKSAYEGFILEINLSVILFVLALPEVFKKKGRHYLLLAFALGTLGFVFSYPYRYISGQGLLGLILLSAVGIERVWLKGKKAVFFLLIFLFICSPALFLMRKQPPGLAPFNSTYVNLAAFAKSAERPNDYSLCSSKFIPELVKIIRDNSQKEEIIFTNLKFIGTMLCALSDRPYAAGGLNEVMPLAKTDPFANARLIIWFNDPGGRQEQALAGLVSKYGLEKIAETEIAQVYRNNATRARADIPSADVSNKLILIIALLVIAVFVWDWGHP